MSDEFKSPKETRKPNKQYDTIEFITLGEDQRRSSSASSHAAPAKRTPSQKASGQRTAGKKTRKTGKTPSKAGRKSGLSHRPGTAGRQMPTRSKTPGTGASSRTKEITLPASGQKNTQASAALRAQRTAELKAQRTAELKAQRTAELKAQRTAELKAQRTAELRAQRTAELGALDAATKASKTRRNPAKQEAQSGKLKNRQRRNKRSSSRRTKPATAASETTALTRQSSRATMARPNTQNKKGNEKWAEIRAYNKRATRGMNLKQKSQYYISQIGPTVQTIKEDPVEYELAKRIIILLIALLLAIHITSCANDILGFARSNEAVEVTLDSGMTTSEVIGLLDREGLIKHSTFCKAFFYATSFIRDDADATYLKGTYTMTGDMGLEKQLRTCMNIQKQETVEVSIPEGLTVYQIAELLEKNKVCAKEDFLEACNNISAYDYSFLETIDDASQRYYALEGFLYPDTYEFYVAEGAESVVTRMLDNFESKWTDEYTNLAEERGLTVDEVVTLASIVQREDNNAENMRVIASVFLNRLASSAYPYLQSDATTYYVSNYIKDNVTDEAYETYLNLYSTYYCEGLPVGAICSPGNDAIYAVLNPAPTGYYFFSHDEDGNLYTASSANEQNANVYKAMQSDTSD